MELNTVKKGQFLLCININARDPIFVGNKYELFILKWNRNLKKTHQHAQKLILIFLKPLLGSF